MDLRWPTYAVRNLELVEAVPADAGGALYVKDAAGAKYLDAVNGVGCAPLGHGHPRWTAALHGQMARLVSVANTFWTAPQQQLAQRLAELFPVLDGRTFFSNTGAEATEAAIKLVVRATGRNTIIAFDNAFHGRTLAALAVTGTAKYREPYVSSLGEPDTGFMHARVIRLPYGDLEAVSRAFAEHGAVIASVFVEPIQGEAGVFPATREFLVGLRKLCTQHGALLGVDEVQSGCGRTGQFSAWTTIVGEDRSLWPDVIWLAKALGGGFPVAACLARADLAEKMGKGTHGTTFGGNPLACVAALTTLSIMQDENLLAQAAAQLPTLQSIAKEQPIVQVTEIRGLGAMIGMQLGATNQALADQINPKLQAAGVLATVCGGHTIRLLLPYHAGRAELQHVWTTLARVCAEHKA